MLLCRAAEDELVEVAEERDKLAPQIQELAWQNRSMERRTEELNEKLQQSGQVSFSAASLSLSGRSPIACDS